MPALKRDLTLLLAGAALMAAGYSIARVQADGAPTAQPLWYSGTVSDAQGAPLTGNHQVSVRLFDTEEPTAQSLCVVGPKDVGFANGRFRVDVSQCESKQQTAAVFASKADLFVELTVDDGSKPFKRAKIGAVPFAIEAQHAVSASSASQATAGSNLESRLAVLESRSGFRASRSAAQSIPTSITTAIDFQEEFDLGTEFDPATDMFAAKKAGTYFVSCAISYANQDAVVASYHAIVVRGGSPLLTGYVRSSADVTAVADGVVHLQAGDALQCAAWHDAGTNRSTNGCCDPSRTAFSGFRLALD
jgi:hypothetical protein